MIFCRVPNSLGGPIIPSNRMEPYKAIFTQLELIKKPETSIARAPSHGDAGVGRRERTEVSKILRVGRVFQVQSVLASSVSCTLSVVA
jgi:hypothetical protein